MILLSFFLSLYVTWYDKSPCHCIFILSILAASVCLLQVYDTRDSVINVMSR